MKTVFEKNECVQLYRFHRSSELDNEFLCEVTSLTFVLCKIQGVTTSNYQEIGEQYNVSV